MTHYGAMLGANRSLLALVCGLQRKGVKLVVWCPKYGAFTEALKSKNIPFEVYGYKNGAAPFLHPEYWLLPISYLKNKAMLGVLTEAAKRIQPDIIHSNSSVLLMGAYIADALKVPHVWHIREFAKLHYNMRFFPGRKRFTYWLSKATRAIVISNAVRKVVIGEKKIPTSLIYNGVVSNSHFKELSSSLPVERKNDNITFLNIGMLHPKKNQMIALEAFNKVAKEYPNAYLLFVGKGRRLYERKLKKYCDTNQLQDRVTFAGYVPHPGEAFKRSDVVLMCSELEAMGRVTVEAMAYGKPVIGYKSGATPELISQGEDGFLYEDGPEQLASCMRYFLRHPEDIKTMGKRGLKKARELFTEENYVDNMHRVFKNVIKEYKTE